MFNIIVIFIVIFLCLIAIQVYLLPKFLLNLTKIQTSLVYLYCFIINPFISETRTFNQIQQIAITLHKANNLIPKVFSLITKIIATAYHYLFCFFHLGATPFKIYPHVMKHTTVTLLSGYWVFFVFILLHKKTNAKLVTKKRLLFFIKKKTFINFNMYQIKSILYYINCIYFTTKTVFYSHKKSYTIVGVTYKHSFYINYRYCIISLFFILYKLFIKKIIVCY